jgi:FAD/FMN-containing dehydrogenase
VTAFFSTLSQGKGVRHSTPAGILWVLYPQAKVVGYGHVGDGNLHLNISTPKADDAVLKVIR